MLILVPGKKGEIPRSRELHELPKINVTSVKYHTNLNIPSLG